MQVSLIICFLLIGIYSFAEIPEQRDTILWNKEKSEIVIQDYYNGALIQYDQYLITNKNGQSIYVFRGADNLKDAWHRLQQDQEDPSLINFISVNDKGQMYLSFTEVTEPKTFSFWGLTGKPGAWQKNKHYLLTVMPEEITGEALSEETPPGETASKDISDKAEDKEQENDEFKQLPYISIVLAIFSVILSLIFSIITFTQQKKVKEQFLSLYDKVTKLKYELSKTQQAVTPSMGRTTNEIDRHDLTLKINDEIHNLLGTQETQNIILAVVKRSIDKLNIEKKGTIPTEAKVQVNETKIEQVLKYDNVVYDSETNTFRIMEYVPVKIFEIIEDCGEFYFTLVDDDSIHQEFLSILGNYKKCTHVIQEASYPSRADVAEHGIGHLFKDGDIFRVDANRPLNIVLR